MNYRRFGSAFIVLACVAFHPLLRARAMPQNSERPRFEVVSIKPNDRHDGQIMTRRTGNRYTAVGVTLGLLLRNAYNVQQSQLIGAPAWAESDRFDIVATMQDTPDTSPVTPDGPTRQSLMLQTLLEERFRLTVHKDRKELPVYALVLARRDGKLGSSLRRSTVDCAAAIAAARVRPGPPPSAPPGELQPCSSGVSPGVILARSQTMAQLANALSRLTNTGSSLGRLIVDRTGLDGYFDIDLKFTPDRMPDFGPGGPPAGMPALDPNAASIYAAMQEQLGLKLEAQRTPVDVLVIDRVEKPTAD